MARIALIKDGTVVSVIEAESADKAREIGLGEGYDDVIENDYAAPGYLYDGNVFAPVPSSRAELLAHAWARLNDNPFVMIDVPGVGPVEVDETWVSALTILEQRARSDSKLRVAWPQFTTKNYSDLNASQIIALAAAISRHHVARLQAYKATIDGIQAGTITNQAAVDDEFPDKVTRGWPPRFNDDVYKVSS
ncbi:MAG TPA: hypothetical protein VGH47_00770 [Xanthobacteraceae bacterium]|jgi:hypothetical protein